MKKKWIFENFNFTVTKSISICGYMAFGEAWYTPIMLLSNVKPDAPRLVKKLRTHFLVCMRFYKTFLLKYPINEKKVNLWKFQFHRYKKDIHMRLQGSRRGWVHPQTASFQCQTWCAASFQKTQNHFLACMELYMEFLTKISHKLKKVNHENLFWLNYLVRFFFFLDYSLQSKFWL